LSLTSPAAPASGKALLRLGSKAAPMARKAVIVSAITLCMVVSSKRDRWIAPLPRFVIHRSDLSHELRKSYLSRFEQLLTVRLAIVHIRAPQRPG
jgi:hypothetical protein